MKKDGELWRRSRLRPVNYFECLFVGSPSWPLRA
jgi:hypothetical protein